MYDKQLNFKVRLINTLRVSEDSNRLSQYVNATFAVNTQFQHHNIARHRWLNYAQMRWNTSLNGNLKISEEEMNARRASVQQISDL